MLSPPAMILLREMSATSMYRREHQPECQCRMEAKSEIRCLPRRSLPTRGSNPMITPSSNADPSPVRPALLPPSAMIQPREMSATRMHRRLVKSK